MRYKALLIDADETLFDFRAAEANAIKEINALVGICADDAQLNYSAINSQCWRHYEKGLITQDEVKVRRFREYLALYECAEDPVLIAEKYTEALSRQCILLDGALEVLDALKGKIPMILVTNGIGRVQRGRLDRGNLWHYFHSVIISQEIGTQKPDPQMLFAALETLDGVKKEDALMCGDSLTSDILAANRAGIDACWYNPKGKVLPEDMHAEYEIRNLPDLISIVLT